MRSRSPLWPAIAIKLRIHRRGRRDEVIGRAAEQFGRHEFDCRHHPGNGFAGHRLGAEAASPQPSMPSSDSMKTDENIVGMRHRLAGHLHRLLHRQADRDGLDFLDLHGAFARESMRFRRSARQQD